jgi:hypothetical protein
MDVYENIVIGNFLFGLGVAMGRRSEAEGLPLSANLLQQTPLDKGCGDVLVQGARAMRILEFKRASNDDFKEKAKLIHLSRALNVPANNDLISLSREAHWFIESKSANQQLNLRMVPYLDFLTNEGRRQELQSFINDLVIEAMRTGPDRTSLFARYLHLVATCQGSVKGSSGGVVVSVDGAGKVNYVTVEDLRELGMTLSQLHAMYEQHQLQRQQERTLQQEQSQRHERKPPSHDMEYEL